MFAKEHYWPIDDTWNYHCGRNEFNSLNVYLTSFNKRYGPAENWMILQKERRRQTTKQCAPCSNPRVRKPATTGIVQ